jgi:uncharacterized protein (DUF2147 family)
MKTLYFAAALLMASTAAHAGNGISFQINGQKVHIEAPRNCESLSCIQVTGPGMSGNLKSLKSKPGNGGNSDDDNATTSSTPPAQVDATPPVQKAAPAPAAPAPAPQVQAPAPAPVASNPPSAPAAEASNNSAPLLHDVTPSGSTVSTLNPPPASTTAAATPAPAAAAAPAAQPVAGADAPATPVGLWATQDNKGNVQIEQCGQNLCGYAEKTREPILINMKPSNNKWTGRIHDPDGGSNYDSTIAMKGPNLLKVQGCAFGGLFCGGQTWKRIS